MTEAEWLSCTDPQPMLEFLRGKASDRKRRLFACACHRRIWHLLGDAGDLRKAVELIEQYADDLAGEQERGAVGQAEQALIGPADRGWESIPWVERATRLAIDLATWEEHQTWEDAQVAPRRSASADLLAARATQDQAEAAYRQAVAAERGVHCRLLRDIFGLLPFRPVTIPPSSLVWNDGTVVKLAQAIYEGRAFDRLPILADALEEAGCHDPDIPAHCRRGEHVRGCWLVDLLLGKE